MISKRVLKAIDQGAVSYRPGGKKLKPGRVVRLAMFNRCGGNAALAARRLGIAAREFSRWLERIGVR